MKRLLIGLMMCASVHAGGYTDDDKGPHVLTLFHETAAGFCIKRTITGYDHKHSCDSTGFALCDMGEYDEFECDKQGEESKWFDEYPQC